jgi:hypothetical protein
MPFHPVAQASLERRDFTGGKHLLVQPGDGLESSVEHRLADVLLWNGNLYAHGSLLSVLRALSG